jgi:hypothetical protein
MRLLAYAYYRVNVRDAPDIRPDNPVLYIQYLAGHQIALSDIQPEIW